MILQVTQESSLSALVDSTLLTLRGFELLEVSLVIRKNSKPIVKVTYLGNSSSVLDFISHLPEHFKGRVEYYYSPSNKGMLLEIRIPACTDQCNSTITTDVDISFISYIKGYLT